MDKAKLAAQIKQDLLELKKLGKKITQAAFKYVDSEIDDLLSYYDNGMTVTNITEFVITDAG